MLRHHERKQLPLQAMQKISTYTGGNPSPIARRCLTGLGTGSTATGLRRAFPDASWNFMTVAGYLPAAFLGQSVRNQELVKWKESCEVRMRGNGTVKHLG